MLELIHPTAERIVASAIAKAGDNVKDLLDIVDASDFTSIPLQIIVESVRRLQAGIEPIDLYAIESEAKQFMKETGLHANNINEKFLQELISMDTRRAPAYAHTVHRMAWLRQFQATIEWANAELATLPDPDELYQAAQAQLAWLKPPTKDNRFVFGWETQDFDATIARREREAMEGVAVVHDYPWQDWNKRIKPLRPGMVGIVAGPEGGGKSAFLEMIAEHWARFEHVVFVHLENNVEYTVDRRMARWSHVAIDDLEGGSLAPEQKAKVNDASIRLNAIAPQLHYFDASGLAMHEIVKELETRRNDGLCDSVILDYLDKLRPSRGQVKLFGDSTHERQADDLEQFKAFCEAPQKKVVGFTASQLTKAGKREGRKTSADMRGSGLRSAYVQLVVMIDREILDAPIKDTSGKILFEAGEQGPTVKVQVVKQNRGRQCEFEQVYVGKHFTIKDKYNV